ncbi:GntR family transcriptional regulator [Tissierella creatinophila]|uniref:HTH-type transcriptional repressor YtrA n=1 Tax=Tissierella creatinophila DSM 6911 TaxID=1123403 RepID=A0A1U7M7A9_TISCR|nr:GntR family transcriptional regulator [Tissierella creatinophila]OLS03099.1 HTH-type transcriptional repressor YtrA [Tissierella creatinophila DSM 6911]
MNFKDNLPIYIQIMNYIKKEMVIRKIKEGDKLPSVRELSTTLTVNPNTIQRAYTELEREGLVFTQRGMGTFATEDIEKIESLKKDMAKSLVDNFLIDMQSLNFSKEEIKKLIDL